jgi:hypothetical protein
MPEEIKEAKKNELKELKRKEKNKKEAVKFELKYKKIKFFGINSYILININLNTI